MNLRGRIWIRQGCLHRCSGHGANSVASIKFYEISAHRGHIFESVLLLIRASVYQLELEHTSAMDELSRPAFQHPIASQLGIDVTWGETSVDDGKLALSESLLVWPVSV